MLTNPTKPLRILGVSILNASGGAVLGGLDASLEAPLPAFGIVEFTTQTMAPGKNLGPITIYMNGFYDLPAGGQGNFWITTTRIDTDTTGAIVSTNTTDCLGGHN